MKDKDLVKLLQQNGWKVARVHGSHHIMQKDNKIETVPVHGKDVPIGLLKVTSKNLCSGRV